MVSRIQEARPCWNCCVVVGDIVSTECLSSISRHFHNLLASGKNDFPGQFPDLTGPQKLHSDLYTVQREAGDFYDTFELIVAVVVVNVKNSYNTAVANGQYELIFTAAPSIAHVNRHVDQRCSLNIMSVNRTSLAFFTVYPKSSR